MMSADEYQRQQTDPVYKRMRALELVVESQSAAMTKIMRRLGIVGASHAEIAEQVIKRLDGCESVIDSMRKTRKAT